MTLSLTFILILASRLTCVDRAKSWKANVKIKHKIDELCIPKLRVIVSVTNVGVSKSIPIANWFTRFRF